MTKPRILITAALGKTGAATARQLLEKGFPVRVMVRTADTRSEQLWAQGAEVVVGSLDDMTDVRRALAGVQRAYFCAPFSREAIADSVMFAIAANENKLEMVAVMSQWLADPTSASTMTRDMWLADSVFSWMPDVPRVTVNPGWFADNYRMVGYDLMAQTGLMIGPFGDGQNAPPSNEDIARVIVGTLIEPAPHLGKTYRPTGPHLLSPQNLADTYGKVLGRKIRYIDFPAWISVKAIRSVEPHDYQLVQVLTYIDDYKRNAFGIGAPTSAVLEVSGQAPEDFETIARRYLTAAPNIKRGLTELSRTVLGLVTVMLTPGVQRASYLKRHDIPHSENAQAAVDSVEWRATHGTTKSGDGLSLA